jgi:hypothetical protein
VFKGANQPWRLGKFYGDPIFAIRSNGDGFQRELEGACQQESLRMDRYITKELTNNLFNSKKFENETQGRFYKTINWLRKQSLKPVLKAPTPTRPPLFNSAKKTYIN